jgi:hypothetical protein
MLLLVLGMLLPNICHAQTKCPWLNEATAQGFLGSPVAAAVKLDSQGDGLCEFSRGDQPPVGQLRILVKRMTDIHKQFPKYLAHCPQKSTPIQAIGNEAVMCSTAKTGRYEETVVGRVRDQAFIVTVSSAVDDDRSKTEERRRKRVTQVAEQVAGILF